MKHILAYILLILLLSCLNTVMSGQTFSKTYNFNDGIDAGFKVFKHNDNYFVQFWGENKDYSDPSVIHVTNYMGFLRTDLEGNLITSKIYDSLICYKTMWLKGDKLLMAGNKSTKPDFEKKIYLLTTGYDGEIQDEKKLEFNTGNHRVSDSGRDQNKNYYLTDRVIYYGDNNKEKLYFNDTILLHKWDSTLNYKKTIMVPFLQPITYGVNTAVHNDNYFVSSIMYFDTIKGSGSSTRTAVVAYDSTGQLLWQYNPLKNRITGGTNVVTETAGFKDSSTAVLMSYDYLGNTWQQVIKFNNKGEKLWEYDDKPEHPFYYYTYFSIFKTKDDGVILCGENSFFDFDPDWDKASAIIAKLDKNGNLQWRRYIWDHNVQARRCGFINGMELDNGNLIITGTLVDSAGFAQFDTRVWLLLLDSVGCYNPGCVKFDSITATQNIVLVGKDMLKLSPNPAHDYVRVSWNNTPTPAERLLVYDLKGRTVAEKTVHDRSGSIELSVTDLPAGTYLVKIQGNKWESPPEKMVRQK